MTQLFARIIDQWPVFQRFHRFIIPGVVFVVITLIFLMPMLQNIGYWGARDWDHFFFLSSYAYDMLTQHGQMPWWNPYWAGGTPYVGYPSTTIFSPLFPIILLLGPVIGMKIQILTYFLIGLLSMYLLARELRLGRLAAYYPPLVFMLCSVYPLYIAAGFYVLLPLALIPLVFFFYLRSLKSPSWLLGGSLTLAIMYLGGDVYHIVYLGLFIGLYALFLAIEGRHWRPIALFTGLFGLFPCFCALKFLPDLVFILENPRETAAYGGYPFVGFLRMLFSRAQTWDAGWTNEVPYVEYFIPNWAWWEYGAYIGIFPILPFLVGLVKRFHKSAYLCMCGLILTLTSFGITYPHLAIWPLLHRLPIFNSMRCQQRLILLVVFCISLIAGHGLNAMENWARSKPQPQCRLWLGVILFILLGTWLDLNLVNQPISRDAFVVKPVAIERRASYRQGVAPDLYGASTAYFLAYRRNEGGVKGGFLPIPIIPAARGYDHPYYQGEVYLARGQGRIIAQQFRYNDWQVQLALEAPDRLVLNQNAFRGWQARVNGQTRAISHFYGVVALDVKPGDSEVVFFFRPPFFKTGLAITGLALLLSAALMLSRRHKLHRRGIPCRP